MTTASRRLEHYRKLLASMPPVAALAIEIHALSAERVELAAPLAANVNDKGCAFGGSIASVATLAGWLLVNARVDELGATADVYVQTSTVNYLAPLFEDLRIVADLADADDAPGFAQALRTRGRGRIAIQATAVNAAGVEVATFSGRFVAIAAPGTSSASPPPLPQRPPAS